MRSAARSSAGPPAAFVGHRCEEPGPHPTGRVRDRDRLYAMLGGRQQVRWIASYIEELFEGQKGQPWFTRVHRLQNQPGFRATGDWLTVCLANAGVILALKLAWMYSDAAARGDLMAGIATGCGVLFGFHSVSETVRMGQTDYAAMWRQVSGDLKEAPRTGRAASW